MPDIPTSAVHLISDLPLAAFELVFLLKVQAWEDHRHALKEYLRLKQHTDVQDIDRMLPLAVAKGSKPRSVEWLPASFVSSAERRVIEYVKNSFFL
jgi:hypothetical protein